LHDVPKVGTILPKEGIVSFKRTADKQRPDWPWTARQRRTKAGGRKTRKFARHQRSK
jgi:hypothetical protein